MRYLFLSLLMISVIGCGAGDDGLMRTVPAKGVLYCDGKPLEGGVVVIMQDDGKNFAQGLTDSQGRFSLDRYEQKEGAVPGTYKVTVSKTVTIDKATPVKTSAALQEDAQHAAEGEPDRANASWVNDLPNKYKNPTTSGLEVTIPEDGTTDLKIEITRG